MEQVPEDIKTMNLQLTQLLITAIKNRWDTQLSEDDRRLMGLYDPYIANKQLALEINGLMIGINIELMKQYGFNYPGPMSYQYNEVIQVAINTINQVDSYYTEGMSSELIPYLVGLDKLP